jgi:hypothetical protein
MTGPATLLSASRTVGAVIKSGDIVVYESTVYPGAVEEDCLPVLEKMSGLKAGADFTAGYSPERINPGDRDHRFETIKKIVAGQDERVATPPRTHTVPRSFVKRRPGTRHHLSGIAISASRDVSRSGTLTLPARHALYLVHAPMRGARAIAKRDAPFQGSASRPRSA